MKQLTKFTARAAAGLFLISWAVAISGCGAVLPSSLPIPSGIYLGTATVVDSWSFGGNAAPESTRQVDDSLIIGNDGFPVDGGVSLKTGNTATQNAGGMSLSQTVTSSVITDDGYTFQATIVMDVTLDGKTFHLTGTGTSIYKYIPNVGLYYSAKINALDQAGTNYYNTDYSGVYYTK